MFCGKLVGKHCSGLIGKGKAVLYKPGVTQRVPGS